MSCAGCLSVIMLSFIMLSVIILSAIMLRVIVLSVVAPLHHHQSQKETRDLVFLWSVQSAAFHL